MEFKKYQHIVKLGCDEVDGILNGTVYLFYKIDGTNSQVFLKDDGATLGFGSRNREVSLLMITLVLPLPLRMKTIRTNTTRGCGFCRRILTTSSMVSG